MDLSNQENIQKEGLFIHQEIKQNVCLVRLTRPEKRNALSRSMRKHLLRLVEKNAKNYPCVILTGSDPAFCSGLDLKENPTDKDAADFFNILEAIHQSETLFIAAVNGAARGGGMMLANACDLVLASERASFGMPGEIPVSSSGHQNDLQEKTEAWLAFAGRTFSAQEVMVRGFVDAISDHEDLLENAKGWAEHLTKLDPTIVKQWKKDRNPVPFGNAIKHRVGNLETLSMPT